MTPQPPKIATKILALFSPRAGRDEILGDLIERYLHEAEVRGPTGAKRWYWGQVLKSSLGFAVAAFKSEKIQGDSALHGQKKSGRMPASEGIGSVVSDIRIAFRSFIRQPAVFLVATLSLCIGIGTSVTIFSVVDVYIFRALPFPEPDRLVHVYSNVEERGWTFNSVSIPDFLEYRDQSTTMDICASYASDVNLSGESRPERVGTERVSWNYFDVFQIQPRLGRFFLSEEENFGRHHVALLSERLWANRFGSNPDVLDQIIRIDGEPHTIVGIVPADFRFGLAFTDVWLPFGVTGEEGNGHFLTAIGRLRNNVTVEQANADVSATAIRWAEATPEVRAGWGAGARALNEFVTPRESIVGMTILSVAAAFVLLIACSNVANLMLTQAAGRTREIAVMGALGASRSRIVRQLLTHSMAVAIVGGLFGTLLSFVGVRWFISLMPAWVPRIEEIGVDARVLAFAVLLTAITGLMFGIVPALRSSSPDYSESLKTGARGTATSGGNRIRKALVISEVTLALTLLVGSTLLVRGFFALQSIDTGWNEENVLTFRISLPESEYSSSQSIDAFYGQLTERISSLPMVTEASATSSLPILQNWNDYYEVPGQEAPTRQQRPTAEYRFVMPDYFNTMEISSLSGRYFSLSDSRDTRPIVIINEMLASRHWPEEDPVGLSLIIHGESREIVGVVENSLAHRNRVVPTVFLPALQEPVLSMSFVVRATGEPTALVDAIRAEVTALDPNVPIYSVATMTDVLKEERMMDTLMAKLMAAIAAVALILSLTGVYGLISYSVEQRTQEMGIRMALGAQEVSLVSLVLRQALILTCIGMAVGIVAALLIARGMSLWLFGVSPFDPLAFGFAIVLLTASSITASYVPARRIARLDPLEVLRYE